MTIAAITGLNQARYPSPQKQIQKRYSQYLQIDSKDWGELYKYVTNQQDHTTNI